MIEIIGVLATLFILISLTQSKNLNLRVLNAVGSVLFVIYGLCIGAFSVWFLNLACFIVDVYKAVKHKRD